MNFTNFIMYQGSRNTHEQLQCGNESHFSLYAVHKENAARATLPSRYHEEWEKGIDD